MLIGDWEMLRTINYRLALGLITLLCLFAKSADAQMEALRELKPGESTAVGDVEFTMNQKNAGTPNDEGWYSAVSLSGAFRVALPGPYVDFKAAAPTEDGVKAITHTLSTRTVEGASFTVMCIRRSDEVVQPQWIDTVVGGFEGRSDEIEKQAVSRGDMTGLAVRVNGRDSTLLAEFLEGETEVCQLMIEYPFSEEDYMPELAAIVFDSFEPRPSNSR